MSGEGRSGGPEEAGGVDERARMGRMRQTPRILWFTGLPGSGKSTIAGRVERLLSVAGRRTCLIDGDDVRRGLSRDLGFTDVDRAENVRRVGEVAKMMLDAGLIVLVSLISPFRAERDMVRRMAGEGEFVEIFVDAPLEVCESRDPKGLYASARAGEIVNFTGLDSPYEAPGSPRSGSTPRASPPRRRRAGSSVSSRDGVPSAIIGLGVFALRHRAFLYSARLVTLENCRQR